MPVFDVAMLIICWIIKGSKGQKQYTHQQLYMITNVTKFAHKIFHIVESLVKWSQSTD
jgi:hypothetical protein